MTFYNFSITVLKKNISVKNGGAHTNNDYAVFKASNICDVYIY